LGTNRPAQYSQPFKYVKKNHFIFSIALGLFLTGCTYFSGNKTSSIDTKTSSSLDNQIVNSNLNISNSIIALSVDGQMALFTSQNRRTHKNPQVYAIDLASQKETRLTWSDGDTQPSLFMNERNDFIYFSDSDLLKLKIFDELENSERHKGKELFYSSWDGNIILKTEFTTDKPIEIKSSINRKKIFLLALEKNIYKLFELKKHDSIFNVEPRISWNSDVEIVSFIPTKNDFVWIEREKKNSSHEDFHYLIKKGKSAKDAIVLEKSSMPISALQWIIEDQIFAYTDLQSNASRAYSLKLSCRKTLDFINQNTNSNSKSVLNIIFNNKLGKFVVLEKDENQFYFRLSEYIPDILTKIEQLPCETAAIQEYKFK
jgi:hypothetical protein